MDILYIVSCLDRGGLELRLLEFARVFPGSIRLHICVTSGRLDLLPLFQEAGARITVIPMKRAYLEPGNLLSLYRYIERNKIGMVNTFDFKGLVVAVLLKLMTPARLRVVHNTVDLLHSYNGSRKFLLRWLFRRVDHGICNSGQARELLASLGIPLGKLNVIGNGVDSAKFCRDLEKRKAVRARYGLQEEEMVLGTVANFRWEKNYPFLIESFSILAERHANLRLLCVGGGGGLAGIESLASERGIRDRIIFTGYVDNVPDYLQAMDVFVLCSLKESFPNALIQAMSCGVPAVVSDIGACRDIIESGVNGLKFEVNNVPQFVSQVERVRLDRGLTSALSMNGQQSVESRYSQAAMLDGYINLYRQIAAHDA